MSGLFKSALDSELIESNPVQLRVNGGSKRQLEVDPLTEEEAYMLLEKVRAYQDGIGTILPCFVPSERA